MSPKQKENISILAIDSEDIKEYIFPSNYQIIVENDYKKVLDLLKKSKFNIILIDIKFLLSTKIEINNIIEENQENCEIILLTEYFYMDKTIEVLPKLCQEFLVKPFSNDTFKSMIERVLKKNLLKQNEELLFQIKPIKTFYGLIGQSDAMQKVFNDIIKAATTMANVLITGESGTGKELVSRAIHYNSLRSSAPFVPVHCGGIPESLLESELFGYEKGAFTGADISRKGFLFAARGGTLFLDEISEASISIQVKLLRVVQDKEYFMLGSRESQKADVRIITATNRDILTMIEKKSFREDLYFRLNVIPIELPPLRERKEDIKLLSNFFILKYCKEFHKTRIFFTDQAYQALLSYTWPGNVRELENVIQRLVVMNDKQKIDFIDLPKLIQDAKVTIKDNHFIYKTLEQMSLDYIKSVLIYTKGNKTHAAKILDIDRKTLWEKLKKVDINLDNN